MKKPKWKTFSVRVSEPMHRILSKQAEKEMCPLGLIVRLLIVEALEARAAKEAK